MAIAKDLPISGFTSPRAHAKMIERLAQALPHSKGAQAALSAMTLIPRHYFIDGLWQQHASQADRSLPIGLGQTLSQAETVAKMTAYLCDHGITDNVLEIGTGSGYQAAILAQVCKTVYTIERLKTLQDKAKILLNELGCHNVHYLHGDGFLGWPSAQPFDAILLTAAPFTPPQTLMDQLKPNGILIAPIGQKQQRLTAFKAQDTGWIEEDLGTVAFVTMLEGTQ